MWVCRLNILEFPELGRKALCSRFLCPGGICICFSVGKWGLFLLGPYVNPLAVSHWERTLWHECSGNHFFLLFWGHFYGILAHREPFLCCSQWETDRPSYLKMQRRCSAWKVLTIFILVPKFLRSIENKQNLVSHRFCFSWGVGPLPPNWALSVQILAGIAKFSQVWRPSQSWNQVRQGLVFASWRKRME